MTKQKLLLNERIHVVEGNSKLTGDENSSFLIFNLPAGITCPYSTSECRFICYAKFEERYPSVRKSRTENYEESMKDSFVTDMINHIESKLSKSKYQNKHVYFRIHSSGDFYNLTYFNKWIEITSFFKDDSRITFEAYTKSIPYITAYDIDDINITLVYSIMTDTDPMMIALARDLGLKTFSALPKGEVTPIYSFKCNGNCGPCTACYHKDNGIDDISIEYHGARAKVKRD